MTGRRHASSHLKTAPEATLGGADGLDRIQYGASKPSGIARDLSPEPIRSDTLVVAATSCVQLTKDGARQAGIAVVEALQHLAHISVQTRDFRCEGDIVIPRPGGYKGRVHDILNGNEQFLALTDVTLYKEGPGAEDGPLYYDVLLLRKDEIQFVIPMD